jgi:hypothetical protein
VLARVNRHPLVSSAAIRGGRCAGSGIRSVAAQRAEERAEIRGEEAGFFEGEEVPAAGGACPLADVRVAAFGVFAGIVAVFVICPELSGQRICG